MTIDQTLAAAISHHKLGRLTEAESLYRQVLAQQPDHAEALHLAGVVAHQSGRSAEASDLIARAIALKPAAADFHCNQGIVLAALGQTEPAVASFQQAISLKPDYAEAHANLAMILLSTGQSEQGITELKHWIALQPNNPVACDNLALALMRDGKSTEAIEAARQTVAFHPDRPDSLAILGESLRRAGHLDDASAVFRRALAIRPDHPDALKNLGSILAKEGRIEEALDCFEKSLAVRPDVSLESKRLFTLWFDNRRNSHEILQEHRKWNDRHARPLASQIKPHANDRSPDRPLRIGYVCPFLIETPVGWNLFPLLAHRDRSQIRAYCYSAGSYRDEMTDRIAAQADEWRDIAGISDEKVAHLIRADQIDILVDLSLHSASNRLLVFARKPAPVQVTYLAYCGTSGLDTMDYRISDSYFDPPGSDLTCYSERTILLPHAYWSYEPGGPTPDPTPLPASSAGCITFASLNHPSKVSSAALSLWARVLAAVPNSRMLIHTDTRVQNNLARRRFATAGVASDRVKFLPHQSWAAYVRSFDQIDVALDTLPYGGGIAACDALWMGLPVVTLIGRTPVGRGAFSILSNIGLPELAARDADEFACIAANLAADLPRLAATRATLRQRMQNSPLRNPTQFTRDVESAYRLVWRNWCKSVLA